METLNMSQLRGFSVGGTIHIIINNQVGFTTSNPKDTRSTNYCSDIAKMIEAPVFHVNSDDPEAVYYIAQLAIDYRYRFKKDVIIDLVCYRRNGHNEADEPAATQPIMYKVIKDLPSVKILYSQKLIAEKILTMDVHEKFAEDYRNKLDKGVIVAPNIISNSSHSNAKWDKYTKNIGKLSVFDDFDSSCNKDDLVSLGQKLSYIPDDFVLQSQVQKIVESRSKMNQGLIPIDWGYAEMLAYASLINEGFGLRLCGQDSKRGTFAHRHAVVYDQNTGKDLSFLNALAIHKKQITIIDSILSEEAVLAFEYGYSTTDPNTLVIWEAQFGDFANGAQVVIDQFISSGEQKWSRLSGLVMLLPHGYEGAGPEHSSARLERFLQLCAEHNIQVCVPSTPSQIFHLLRRQMLRDYRRPLVIMSPKTLLRHKLAVSSIDELTSGNFALIINEQNNNILSNNVNKVILCSGKIYYELLQEREANNINDIAIIRIEQLYPFPEEQLKKMLAQYKNAKKVVWCQEEPQNQGAWYCTAHNLTASLSVWQKLEFVGRLPSSSPAAGSYSLHNIQQANLLKQAINN